MPESRRFVIKIRPNSTLSLLPKLYPNVNYGIGVCFDKTITRYVTFALKMSRDTSQKVSLFDLKKAHTMC